MKIGFHQYFRYITILTLILSGCALQHGAPFEIIAPHDRAVLPLGSAIFVNYRTLIPQDPHLTFFNVEVFDNGVQFDHLLYPGNMTAGTSILRSPAPGGHLLSARASAVYGDGRPQSNWYSSNVVCVFVGTPPSGSDFCSSTYSQQSSGLQVGPTLTPTPTPIPVIDNVQAFPSPIYYGETCPTISTVTFRAALTLPSGTTPDLVDVEAHVDVRAGSGGTSAGNLLVHLLPNGTTDTASGGAVFLGTVALTHSYNDALNHFDPASLGGSSGALLWYADASSHDPSNSNALFLGRSANQVLDLAPCPTSGHTPGHNGNGNGSGPVTGCGQYSNQTSCDLAGCSWSGSSCTVSP